MRKIIIYILGFVLICFTIPIIFTKGKEAKPTENPVEAETKEENQEEYTYAKYGTVRLLHNETGEVETLEMDNYLYGVVSAEMPANFELEALKAQAIVARTYTAYKMFKGSKHANADICDDSTCCQAWISKEDRLAKWNEAERQSNWDKIVTAVDTTKGKIITYNGEPINAFFHSNSGGSTESVANVWGGTDYPYLQSVETAGEEGYTQYSSSVTLTKEEEIKKRQETHPERVIHENSKNHIHYRIYRKWKSKNNSIWKYKYIRCRSKNHIWIKVSKI